MFKCSRFLNTCATICISSVIVGCSAERPTAPTAITTAPPLTSAPTTPTVTTPPVVSTPATPTPNPLLSDPRFSLAFYRQLISDTYEGRNVSLNRQGQPPRIYVRTIDDAGAAIDAATVNAAASAIESTVGQMTGVYGIAGLERGTDSHEGQAGWITVKWSSQRSADNVCGRAPVGGTWMEFYPRNNCRCAGGPAVAVRVIKHELGHAMGFWHTDSPNDLMYIQSTTCDQNLSAREAFHMHLAYTQAIGSLDPK